jgi:hypothetical protein
VKDLEYGIGDLVSLRNPVIIESSRATVASELFLVVDIIYSVSSSDSTYSVPALELIVMKSARRWRRRFGERIKDSSLFYRKVN